MQARSAVEPENRYRAAASRSATAGCMSWNALTPQLLTKPGVHETQDAPSWQREIVRLASDGLANRQIGDRLFLSPRTWSSRPQPHAEQAVRKAVRGRVRRTHT
jgi:DNA-binding NarL/FixJ family response regulator